MTISFVVGAVTITIVVNKNLLVARGRKNVGPKIYQVYHVILQGVHYPEEGIKQLTTYSN